MAAIDSLLENAVSTVLGLKETAATDTANAAAATTQATGYASEASAYQTAEDIANQNATIAQTAGEIKQLQQQRALNLTLGEQKAQVAASGFGAAGSNLDILRSSLQQGYLTQQLTATQTSLTAGGYLEEAAAAETERVAAGVTGAAATSAAASYTAASALAKANAATETAAINDYLGTGTLTSDQKLITAPLTADVTKPTTLPAATSTTPAWVERAQKTFTTPSSMPTIAGASTIANPTLFNLR